VAVGEVTVLAHVGQAGAKIPCHRVKLGQQARVSTGAPSAD
jgi:hypothetical protein